MNNLTEPVVLVVDNDPLICHQLIAILNAHGFATYTAGDLYSAVAAANRVPLDLIICQSELEPISGEQVVHVIRQCPGRSDVPVIFTSSSQSCDVIRRMHKFGAAFHLKRPVDAQVLIELADQALWMPHLVRQHLHQPLNSSPHFPRVDVPTGLPSVFGETTSLF